MQKYDGNHINELLSQLLGYKFISVFIIDMPETKHINLLVKTTEEIDWGVEYGSEGCSVWEYLRSFGYKEIKITASREFKGEWII